MFCARSLVRGGGIHDEHMPTPKCPERIESMEE